MVRPSSSAAAAASSFVEDATATATATATADSSGAAPVDISTSPTDYRQTVRASWRIFARPDKFLGDQQRPYNATLSYELYLAGGGNSPGNNAGATPTTPHAPGSHAEQAYDAILLGGQPRYKLQPPPWEVWDKHAIFEWSRERFPELPLNLRWSKERMVTTVEAYLDTPQVALGIRARRMKHYPPETCEREHCSVNFNFDLNEHDAWINIDTIPAGLGWSSGDGFGGGGGGGAHNLNHHAGMDNPHVTWTEGTAYAGQRSGAPYNPFDGFAPADVAGTGYPGSAPPPDPTRTAGGTGRTRGDGGETAWTWIAETVPGYPLAATHISRTCARGGSAVSRG